MHPHSFETPRNGEGGVTHGIGPRKMSAAYGYIMPFASDANLGFYRWPSRSRTDSP